MGLEGKILKKGKMRERILERGRNENEEIYEKEVIIEEKIKEGKGLLRWNEGIMRLKEGIEMKIEFRDIEMFNDIDGKGGWDIIEVKSLNGVEKGKGVRWIVGLKREDKMKLDNGKGLEKGRKFE